MPQTYSTELAGIDSLPVVRATTPAYNGKLRRYRATITAASQAAGDTIVLARLPAGSLFAYGVLTASATMGASATIAIGTAASAGKYRAAATFTSANTPTLFGVATEVGQQTVATTQEEVILTVGTAALPSSGTLVVDLYVSGY